MNKAKQLLLEATDRMQPHKKSNHKSLNVPKKNEQIMILRTESHHSHIY